MKQPSFRAAGPSRPGQTSDLMAILPLLLPFGFSVAGTLALRTRARAPAIGALAAITRPLAHRALARSTAHIALHLMFSHDALYTTVGGLIGYAGYVGATLSTVRKHMQFAEFERLPDSPGKRELLRGELIELPPAKQKHNQIAERMYLRLRDILPDAGNRSLGEVHHEMGYLFRDGSWLQPDVSITHAGQTVEDYYLGAPALAVEIVSDSNTADEIAGKVEMYLVNGASEVWIVYPNRGQIWLHTHDGHAEKHTGTLASRLLGGAVLDLARILA
jgi:Uma2 family endonuclease